MGEKNIDSADIDLEEQDQHTIIGVGIGSATLNSNLSEGRVDVVEETKQGTEEEEDYDEINQSFSALPLPINRIQQQDEHQHQHQHEYATGDVTSIPISVSASVPQTMPGHTIHSLHNNMHTAHIGSNLDYVDDDDDDDDECHHNYDEEDEEGGTHSHSHPHAHPSYQFRPIPIHNHEHEHEHEPNVNNTMELDINAFATTTRTVNANVNASVATALKASGNNTSNNYANEHAHAHAHAHAHGKNSHNYKDDDEDENYNDTIGQNIHQKQNHHHHHNLHIDIHNSIQHSIHNRNISQLDNISPSSSLIADNDAHDHNDDDHHHLHIHNPSLHSLDDTDTPAPNTITTNIINSTSSSSSTNNTANISQQPTIPQPTLPLPPPPSEQTAREQLIERERQGRLERERARLKQQLALSRERDEEDEAFADFDRVRERIASIDDDNNSMDVMDLTYLEEDDHGHGHESSDDQNGIVTATTTAVVIGNGIIPSHAHAHAHPPITGIVQNETIMIGDTSLNPHDNEILVTESNENTISILSPTAIIVGNNNEDGNNNNNIDVVSATNAAAAEPSPLGFTMERFLQDGVVVSSSSNIRRAPVSDDITGVDSDDVAHNNSNVIVPTTGGVDGGHRDDIDLSLASNNDSNTNHQLVDLLSEHSSSTAGIADMSLTAGVGNSSELVSSPPVSRIGGSDAGVGDLGGGSSIGGVGGVSNTSRNEREYSYDNTPRLARLTEAEILELAEIDYASVGNMPPRSERDERHLPSNNDHLAGLGRMSNISDQTHTTMLESISMTSADIDIIPSEVDSSSSPCIDVRDEYRTNDGIVENTGVDIVTHHHDPHQLQLNRINLEDGPLVGRSLVASAASALTDDSSPPIAAVAPINPIEHISLPNVASSFHDNIVTNRSEEGDDYPQKLSAALSLENNEQNRLKWEEEDLKPPALDDNNPSGGAFRINLEHGTIELLNEQDASVESYTLPNRTVRPGITNVSRQSRRSESVLHRRSLTTPNISSFVDDFDYCKYNDPSPNNEGLQAWQGSAKQPPGTSVKDYGSITFREDNQQNLQLQHQHEEIDVEESRALIGKEDSSQSSTSIEYMMPGMKRSRRESMEEIMESVFSSVRSLSTDDIEADINDCDKYLASNVMNRAFPERFAALMVTLIIEIPVLLMISGGSAKLCALIGRNKYQLLIAFLPLSSAISGNCGLQASTLATRAISHLQVTKANYFSWLLTELKVAALLGIAMGVVLGSIAYEASGHDFAFGFTIFTANVISVLTAGLTGTIAPLIFTFIFHRDSGKWGGPLETAIQDIVGSFVMIIFSYRLLLWLGPMEIDPNDTCGGI